MDASKTILVCFLVVTPAVSYVAWRFWRWYILQSTLSMVEEGEMRKQAGMPQAVSA
jgi:hypothetical protein